MQEFKTISLLREDYERAQKLGLSEPEGIVSNVLIDLSQVETVMEDETDLNGIEVDAVTVGFRSGSYLMLLVSYNKFKELLKN